MPLSQKLPEAKVRMADRRSPPPPPADGELKFSFDDPSRWEVPGRLLDHSESGFRASHNYAALHTGQVVEFRHILTAGKARVMWNSISGDRVESGFLIIR